MMSVTEKSELFWDFKGCVDTVDNWPLMSSPFPMLTFTASYLLFVLKYGRVYMKNREPYNLKNVIVLYNILQVIASAYLVYLAMTLSWPHGWVAKTCLLEKEDTRDKLTVVLYYYFLAKMSEVFDTIFFVLRKKYNQVSFLHVYHHTLMIVTSWIFLKYEPIYPSLFIRNINSFVHIIMYTYYALASFPSLRKYLWWKKYITSLQLVQFVLVFIHFALTYAISECTPSFLLGLTVFGNSSFFVYLFGQFYWKTYKNRENKKYIKKENENSNNETYYLKNNNNINTTNAGRKNIMKAR
ncbi:unnamed protein product [Arctia plantaginis]|uniref:Elongation of very long chain fatty acids protein n=1 Tax=Arctia plantaginis TaxID=874455 RepID=A0A8S0Z5R3_ARCPL|nr:unnamed protein product [Arctia plantaginis]